MLFYGALDAIDSLCACCADQLSKHLAQLRFMNMLLRAGADINGTERRHGRTPLMVAIIEGATSAARLLIEQVQFFCLKCELKQCHV